MKNIYFLVFLIACSSPTIITVPEKTNSSLKRGDDLVIAFGSCSDEDKDQPLWDDILAEKANIWIWLGDNIYGDTEDMNVMRTKYNKQKSHPLYQQLIQETMINGTWDDHDYGENDAGKNYPQKVASQKEFLDFLDIPDNHPRRNRKGVYGSQIINHKYAKVHIFYLDARYFRDELVKKNDANIPVPNGVILGEEQWAWLEYELANSQADVHIFASGIQFIPEQHRFEKWANFPAERKRLLGLIKKNDIKIPIVISGDRHIGEISKMTYENLVIHDITSSSLTHGWSKRRPEENKYRKGNIVYDLNYGIITISKNLNISAALKSNNNETETEVIINE